MALGSASAPSAGVVKTLLRDLEPTDQRIARIVAFFGGALLLGLAITGAWQFFEHPPSTSWRNHVVGDDARQVPEMTTGMAAAHSSLADIAAGVVLLIAAWMSYRVLARISWSSVWALMIMMTAILTGGLIRFNATVRDGTVDVETAGYVGLFRGEIDTIVTDRYDLGAGAAIFWTTLHMISVPVLVALVWLAMSRSHRRRAAIGPAAPSWLDRIRD